MKRVRAFQIELEFESLVFKERGKPEYPKKNLSEQGREPTTNSTHIWRRRQDSNPGHIGGRRVLSPLRHPCSLNLHDDDDDDDDDDGTDGAAQNTFSLILVEYFVPYIETYWST